MKKNLLLLLVCICCASVSFAQVEVVKQCPMYDEKSQVFQKKHYGLIAQELQELYPNLVYEVDDRGYLGINYTEIIPMLIQSVQELNKEIEILKRTGSMLKSSKDATRLLSVDETVNKAALYQNAPNPFDQDTQIEQIVITERGEGIQTISGSELTAGIYLYALIVDGKEVDTKRMILTK